MNISPYVFPGLTKTPRAIRIGEEFATHIDLKERSREASVRFSLKRGSITFNKYTAKLMRLEPGMRIDLIIINQQLFVYKTITGGYGVFYESKILGSVSAQPRRLVKSIEALYRIKTTKTFEIRKTNYEYQYAKLYEIKIPKNHFKRIQT